MLTRDTIVIGASAGSIEPLKQIVAAFPEDIRASIFVVLHVPEESPSQLPAILNRAGLVPAAHASADEQIRPGRIYIAPPGHHMLLTPSRIRIERGPRENRQRPGIDPLFRSAADARGSRVIGVILSGALDDGTAGLVVIKTLGGLAVVQDPEDAIARSMPESALASVAADFVRPAVEIGRLLVELVN